MSSRSKVVPSNEWLRHEYIDEHRAALDIARGIGRSGPYIATMLKMYGIPIRNQREATAFPRPSDQWLLQAYVQDGRDANDIGRELGCTGGTVIKWLKSLGLQRPGRGHRGIKHSELYKNQAYLRKAYIDNGRSIEDIAIEQCVSLRQVNYWIHQHGIPVRNYGAGALAGIDTYWSNEQWLRDAYARANRNTAQLAGEIGISEHTLRRYLKHYGIDARTQQEKWDNGPVKNKFSLQFFLEPSAAFWYVLGYAFADGNVSPSHNCLGFTSIDRDLLEKVATYIKFEGPLYSRTYLASGITRTRYTLNLIHQRLPEILLNYNLIPKKSLVCEMPDVPKEHIGHFARGVFDGDGCAHVRVESRDALCISMSFISGSPKFLPMLQQEIADAGVTGGRIDTRSNGVNLLLYTSAQSALGLMQLMYSGSDGLYLGRKKSKCEEYLMHLADRIGRGARCRLSQETQQFAIQLASEWPTIDTSKQPEQLAA